MTSFDTAFAPHWHVIESADRWYQAVLRFSRTSTATWPIVIRRWDAAATGLISWAGQHDTGASVLLWELPAEPKSFVWTLGTIATLTRINPRAVQLAHVPPHRRAATALLVQQAGISFLLDDLSSLEKVAARLIKSSA